MSKGSGRRPASVTEAEIAANYERIFYNKPKANVSESMKRDGETDDEYLRRWVNRYNREFKKPDAPDMTVEELKLVSNFVEESLQIVVKSDKAK